MDALDLLFIAEFGIYITILTVLAAAVVALLPLLPKIAAWLRREAELRKLRKEDVDRKRTAAWNQGYPVWTDEAESK